MMNSSIEYSGLLITRTLHRHKHQLRDFFNRHASYHQSIPVSPVILAGHSGSEEILYCGENWRREELFRRMNLGRSEHT